MADPDLTTGPGHRRWLVWSAVTFVVVVAALSLLHLVGRDTVVTVMPDGQRIAPISARGSQWGFDAEMTVDFPDNRQLQSGAFTLSGKTYPVSFYPNDGTDNDVQPSPLPLTAGVTVTASAKLSPDCAAPVRPPQLLVRSRTVDGSVREDSFGVSNPQHYQAALRGWCSTGVQVTVATSKVTPSGDVEVGLRIVNPGTEPVTVTSDGYHVKGARWAPASITVPPAGTSTLTITATKASCGTPPPWTTGNLKANGQQLKLTDSIGC
jgi:hypothetical protein